MTLPLLLLHGAIGSSAQLHLLKTEFEKDWPNVYLLDFPGHGGKLLPEEPFSIRLFAESVLQWMDELHFQRIDIFGYSMGGYVGLYLAKHYPGRVGKIFTLATKLAWDEATAEKEVKLLDPEKIKAKVPQFAEALEKRHAPVDWKGVLERTAGLMLALGKDPELKPADFSAITTPVLLSVGDRDTMVSVEETMAVFRQIPEARLAVFPATAHPVEQVDVQQVAEAARRFFR